MKGRQNYKTLIFISSTSTQDTLEWMQLNLWPLLWSIVDWALNENRYSTDATIDRRFVFPSSFRNIDG